MLELTNDQLEKVKHIELDVLKEIHRICIKNNISYSLTGGTLLGAIRHKGFIPWDDDIDIVMLQDDYIKFLNIAKKQLSERYYLENWDTDNYFGYPPITKVMVKNTTMRETKLGNSNANDGIFIDIFPLYNSPDYSLLRKCIFSTLQRIEKNIRCRNGFYFKQSHIRRVIYKIRRLLYSLIPMSVFKSVFECILSVSSHNDQSQFVISYGGVYGVEKETLKREWFDDYIEVDFEGYKFLALVGYDEYLKSHYGDYMKLPPLEDRVPHHFVSEIKFGELE